jgi:hypothetical protein
VVIRNADWDLPTSTADGVLVFGTSLYQESNAYLAWFPIRPGAVPPPPTEWRFFCGDLTSLVWRTQDEINPNRARAQNAPDDPTELLDIKPRQPTLGELSVMWVPRMKRWLMTYSHGLCRVARRPWGPWSDEIVIFDHLRKDPAGVYFTQDADNNVPGHQFIGKVNDKDGDLSQPMPHTW